MSINDRPTVIPSSYPALESEAYLASQDAHERETEPPPAPPTVIWNMPRMPRPTLVRLPWGAL
jgi:hypothetical protein